MGWAICRGRSDGISRLPGCDCREAVFMLTGRRLLTETPFHPQRDKSHEHNLRSESTIMRKTNNIWAVAATLLAFTSATLAQQDFSKVEIKATHVASNVYMLEGAGGNIG